MPGTTWKRGKKDQGPKAKARRLGALERAEIYLKEGKKRISESDLELELSDYDKKRIKKEIETLKARVN